MCPDTHPYARDGDPGFPDECVKTEGYTGACVDPVCDKCFYPTCINYER